MSTDFQGIAPTSDTGRHLSMTTRTLLPLTQFLEHIAPDAKDNFFDTWNYNTDEDWTNGEALQLASKIRENVENGHALRWAQANGTPVTGEDNVTLYFTCCGHHYFHADVAIHFAEFLEASGGFTVT